MYSALTAESEQRVRDHDQYMVSLAAVSEAVRGLKNRENRSSGEHVEDKGLETGQHPKRRPEYLLLQALQGDRIPNSVLDQLTFVGDTAAHRLDKDSKAQSRIALVDQRELKRTVDAAESIVQALRKRLEKGSKGFKSKASKRLLCQNSSRSSKSSYHTPQSSISFKSRKYCRSFSSFFSTLQRKNKKLKLKYQRVLEKFKESMNVCGKLQDDIQQMTAKREQTTKQLLEGCTQTETSVCSLSNGGVPGNGAGRPQSSRNIHILQGRLDAAAKVMSKQCKQIQDLQQQLNTSCESIQSLKKRLSRAESSVAGKELLGETSRRQLQDLETKNLELNQELQQLKHTINRLKQELSSQTELSKNLEHEKENALQKFKDLNKCMEIKLSSLSSTLQQKEELSERATSELQVKLSSLRERLMSQTSEARDRLVDADSKIQELYLGIETFLHLLFTLSRRTSSPELSPSSQAHAVQIASDILQLPPGQVQTILDSSRTDNHQLSKWIKECNRLVHNKVFAKNLGHFLLDAVLDAKIT